MRSLLLILLSIALFQTALAAPRIIPAPPQLATEGHILLDAATGTVIIEENAEMRLPPASLTKIMTSYIIASEIQQGRISLDDLVPISVKAWKMEGSRMFIREGTEVKVADLIRGIVIQSGNDASVAMAEFIAGDEDAFADVMNQVAQKLGMTRTQFKNATGLPDEGHYTTAKDLSILARALIRDFPEHYKVYKEKYFSYNDIRQANRNSLLWRDDAVDGMKTGHTQAAGFCLVASAEKKDMRLVSVVMGATSERSRSTESQKLINYGFRYFESVKLYDGLESLRRVKVWGGLHESLDVGIEAPARLTIPTGARGALAAEVTLDPVIKAPVSQGQTLGLLRISLEGETLLERPVVALNGVDEAGLVSSLIDEVSLFFLSLFSGDPLAL
ncbi:MAG TPA: serine-type D-Ala-D-Ala carboxypeptidase [Gammaproteobacteria bacterium]|nr:D-alanyl-D-alanine carboxypeptidase [Gammaproteobacteria bacterium]MDA8911536.1 D-alanyl-D-alanine carboxypeptidase [Pseudomonadales bacterium]MDC1101266.1 D-alanyl-D-alanine carboxypeptidase [Pseudomonadales bacterium]MDC1367309.1 D-alanyl-D-alanine carboxypeptidase [Pseudomonadales bacterium]MDO7572952.1 D-alanyl-D-alanine carboxypeptidase [Pseudomonadales bacterium]